MKFSSRSTDRIGRVVLGAPLVVALALVMGAGCGNKVPEPERRTRATAAPSDSFTAPTKLVTEDLKVGTGPEAKKGDTVKVRYTGWLLRTHFKIDSNEDGKGEPMKVVIGESDVIKGWHEGIVGMKAGGRRKLTIPADLGYGAAGKAPKVPKDAPLLFEIELVSIEVPEAADAGAPEDAGADDAGTDGGKDDKADAGKSPAPAPSAGSAAPPAPKPPAPTAPAPTAPAPPAPPAK